MSRQFTEYKLPEELFKDDNTEDSENSLWDKVENFNTARALYSLYAQITGDPSDVEGVHEFIKECAAEGGSIF